MMRHKTDVIRYAQGWLKNQLEEAAKDQINEANEVIAAQVIDQFNVLDEAIDDLIQENATMFEKLKAIAIENITK